MEWVTKKPKYWLVIVFGLSVLVRFVLGNFYPRTVNCYPDEFLYLSLGESLWNHHNIQVFNVAASFRKVMYPLLISPAFAFADVKMRGTIIALINAGVISLGVFPVYGLAKRILTQKTNVFLCVILYAISPSMTYSMTYMSEVASIPLSLLLLYLIFRVWEEDITKKKIWFGFAAAVATVLCYVAKSIALVFPVAFALIILSEWIFGDNRKKRLVAISLCAVMLLGLLWFGSNLFMLADIFEKSGYIIFGVFFYVSISVLGFCVFPVLLPGIGNQKLEKSTRRLYFFLVYTLIVTAIVVACAVYTTEDYPSLTPRAHLRYVEFMFVPFVMTLLSLMERETEAVSKWKLFAVFGVWAAVLLIVFNGFSGQTVDQTLLFYWQLIADEGKYFSPVKVRVLSIVIILVVAVFVVLYRKNKKMFKRLLVIGLILMSLGNSALSIYVQYQTHTHSSEETAEAEQLREFVLNQKEKTFLVLEPSNYCEMIDTFLIDCDNVRTGLEPVMTQVEQEFEQPSQVDYVILFDQEYQIEREAEFITTYPNLGYSLYQVKDFETVRDSIRNE